MSAWHLIGDLKMIRREEKKGRNEGKREAGW